MEVRMMSLNLSRDSPSQLVVRDVTKGKLHQGPNDRIAKPNSLDSPLMCCLIRYRRQSTSRTLDSDQADK